MFSTVAHTQPIEIIRIEGTTHVDESEIREVIETRAGDDLSSPAVQRQIQDDIRAIWALGFFDDVQALQPDATNDVVFQVEEKSVIKELQYTGNEEFKAKRLNKELEFTGDERIFYSAQTAERFKTQLLTFYTEKAFPNTEISWETKTLEQPNAIAIVYSIKEGKKLPIEEIVFEGNNIISGKKLKKTIQTKESWWFIVKKHFDEAIAQDDINRIRLAYWNVGFLDVDITLAEPEEIDGGLRVKFIIEEGEPYTVGEIDITGNTMFSDEELLSNITLKPGDLFSFTTFRDDEMEMIQLYLGQGYIDTTVNPLEEQLYKDEKNKIVDIHIRLREAERKYLGKVEIQGVVTLEDGSVFPTEEGEFKTKDFVIERELELKEGEPLDWTKVIESDRNLVNLNFFESRPYPVKGQTNLLPGFKRKPIEGTNVENLLLQLEESQTGSLSFGGGLSTSFGPSVFATLTERNLFGYGVSGSIKGEFGKYRNSGTLSLYEPHLFNSDYSVDWDIYYINQEGYRGRRFDQERVGSTVMFGKELNDELTLLFGLKAERADITPDEGTRFDLKKDSIPKEYNLGENTTTSITFGFTHDARDFRLDPTSGTYTRATIELAGLTDNEFIKFRTLGNYYKQLFNKPVLALSAELELGHAYGDPGFIPIQERFFIGGANSVRGFDEGSIGESRIISYDDPSFGGFRTYLGGEAAFVANAELRFPLTEFLQLVGFVDMGSVWPEIGEIDPTDFRFSTGAGVRFRVPGLNAMIRLDFAVPLRKMDGDETEFFHFSFGQTF